MGPRGWPCGTSTQPQLSDDSATSTPVPGTPVTSLPNQTQFNQQMRLQATPAPIQATPAPIQATPAPLQATPTQLQATPAPIQATPTQLQPPPAPIQATPIQPTPIQATPTQLQQIQPTPTQLQQIQPTPTEPTQLQPAPTQPTTEEIIKTIDKKTMLEILKHRDLTHSTTARLNTLAKILTNSTLTRPFTKDELLMIKTSQSNTKPSTSKQSSAKLPVETDSPATQTKEGPSTQTAKRIRTSTNKSQAAAEPTTRVTSLEAQAMKLVTLFTLVALSSSLYMTCQAAQAVPLACAECLTIQDPNQNRTCVNTCSYCDDGRQKHFLPQVITTGNYVMPDCKAACKDKRGKQ
ncbi:hypothetical protein CF326_g8826, partial [Tilletia indica]